MLPRRSKRVGSILFGRKARFANEKRYGQILFDGAYRTSPTVSSTSLSRKRREMHQIPASATTV